MPPRTKKGPVAKRTAARATKGVAKKAVKPPEPSEEAEVKVEEVVHAENKEIEIEIEEGHSAPGVGGDEDAKGARGEQCKGKSLVVDVNDPECEPEGDHGVDYDGKDVEEEEEELEDMVEYEMMDEEGDAAEDGDNDHDGNETEEYDGEEGEGGEDYEGVEEHGIEHHEVVNEHKKRKEFEVFVGGLDKDATQDDLRKVFGQVGDITEIRLMMNPQTKKNKGFAFLRFATVEQAKRAVSELKNPVVNGKQCGVSPSQDSDTLFVGNINKSWTKEKLKEKLMLYGIENIEDMNLVEDTNNKGMNRGFAFLEFSSRSDAMDTFRRLQRRDVLFGVDRTAKVAFADSFIESDDGIMAQVKTVFIDGLPAAWDEDHVKDCLRKFGEIEMIELARNMPSARRKDFGFVTFVTHDAAVACAKGMNNAEMSKGDYKVKVRARLSRPHHRGRGKHEPRRDFRTQEGPQYDGRSSWNNKPVPRGFTSYATREPRLHAGSFGGREFKRPADVRDRRPVVIAARRARNLPLDRSYDRRPPVAEYPRSSSRREYGRRDVLSPRSKSTIDYDSRIPIERRPSFRDEYLPRGPAYSDISHHTVYRTVSQRSYADEAYVQRFNKPLPRRSYGESRLQDYDSLSGSKRSYTAIDDAPPRYVDSSHRQSRISLDYDMGGSSAQYSEAYGDEILDRSHLGYGGHRSSLSDQESHRLYSSSQKGMRYGTGSVSSTDAGGMYSSSFDSGYMSHRSDVGGSPYSSFYSGRNPSGDGYPNARGSGSYY